MILAARLPVHRQTLAQQRLGAGEIAVQPQDRRQIAQADRRLAMLVAEHLPADAQRFALQRLRALVESLVLVDAPELDERDGDVGVFPGPSSLRRIAERLFERARRGRVIALRPRDDAEIVQRLRDADVFGPNTRRPLASACSSSGCALSKTPSRR